MHTSTGARSLRIERVTEQIQIVLPATGRPVSLEDSRHVLARDAESNQRRDGRSDADVWFGLRARGSAHAARDECSADVAQGPNVVQHAIELGTQGEEGIDRKAILPLRPQPVDHFGKPHALGVAARHVARFYDASRGLEPATTLRYLAPEYPEVPPPASAPFFFRVITYQQ
jgi:hypothetical protein